LMISSSKKTLTLALNIRGLNIPYSEARRFTSLYRDFSTNSQLTHSP
jgi:hypothetical protein